MARRNDLQECPICSQHFPTSKLHAHVDQCLTKAQKPSQSDVILNQIHQIKSLLPSLLKSLGTAERRSLAEVHSQCKELGASLRSTQKELSRIFASASFPIDEPEESRELQVTSTGELLGGGPVVRKGSSIFPETNEKKDLPTHRSSSFKSLRIKDVPMSKQQFYSPEHAASEDLLDFDNETHVHERRTSTLSSTNSQSYPSVSSPTLPVTAFLSSTAGTQSASVSSATTLVEKKATGEEVQSRNFKDDVSADYLHRLEQAKFEKEQKEREMREREMREREMREREMRDQALKERALREREIREREIREREIREREIREREMREREMREREMREREMREREREREQREREQREREQREREQREREQREREQREREQRERKHRERDLREQKEREQKEREQKEREQKEREQKEREQKERKTREEMVFETEEDEFQRWVKTEGTCLHCRGFLPDRILYLEACDHRTCTNCLKAYLLKLIESNICTTKDLVCHFESCTQPIPIFMQKHVLSKEEFEKLEEATLKGFMKGSSDFVFCPKAGCGNVFEAVAAKLQSASTTDVDGEGKPLTKEALEDRAKNRFRCPKCTENFCRTCGTMPYHLGKTCEQWSKYQKAVHCRFCADALTSSNLSFLPRGLGRALEHVCKKPECEERRAQSCDKTLSCGHNCLGVRGETSCLECLHPDCVTDSSGVTITDYCNICWTEDFSAAPTVKLACKHFFHFHCVKQKIEKRWPGARITFGFLSCPLCKVEISHPALAELLRPMLRMKEVVQGKALERLKHEGLENDKRLLDKKDRYYGNPAAFSMDRFAYYPCAKCKKPYFGGMRRCEEAAQQDEEKFNPQDLVCGSCVSGKNVQNCKLHKKDYIEFKCKFCCNIATWFCWGNTHFCDSCHKRQEKGDYLNRKPRSALPKCPGLPKCPLGIEHPPNGEEFALGCGICRPRVAAAEEL